MVPCKAEMLMEPSQLHFGTRHFHLTSKWMTLALPTWSLSPGDTSQSGDIMSESQGLHRSVQNRVVFQKGQGVSPKPPDRGYLI